MWFLIKFLRNVSLFWKTVFYQIWTLQQGRSCKKLFRETKRKSGPFMKEKRKINTLNMSQQLYTYIKASRHRSITKTHILAIYDKIQNFLKILEPKTFSWAWGWQGVGITVCIRGWIWLKFQWPMDL